MCLSLFFANCSYRTSTSATATANACISIDFIFSVASFDSSYWTLRFASATHNARIVNYVCHSKILLLSFIHILIQFNTI